MKVQLKNLPYFLKIVILIVIFILVFTLLDKIIIGEKKNALDEAFNEQSISLISIFIAFTIYMIFLYKKKDCN